MPELIWNEYEVIECLGVLPETEEFFTSHYFKLVKDKFILQITIWQIESCIAISISKENDEKPFLTIYFIVRDILEFMNAKNFSSLKFQDCIIVSSRFWMYEENEKKNYFDKDIFPTKLNIELCVYPRLEIKFH
ncbi:MAG: hypothetical protein M3Q99_01955 [Acidobacteriota bacterium]|nr:hypothetical protein [Acidobacteriota bacterium]